MKTILVSLLALLVPPFAPAADFTAPAPVRRIGLDVVCVDRNFSVWNQN